jgi:hypothetical protein
VHSVKIIKLCLAWLVWFSFLFSACQPRAETNAPESTSTEVSKATSYVSVTTETPAVVVTATLIQAANDCLVDNKLPDPDIPENYIGWKPSVDFADLHKQENDNDDYVYWESLLNRDTDFSVAGYRRSDNSYMIF